jgi:hypothetical protein
MSEVTTDNRVSWPDEGALRVEPDAFEPLLICVEAVDGPADLGGSHDTIRVVSIVGFVARVAAPILLGAVGTTIGARE